MNKIFHFLALLLLSAPLFAQPSNDDCVGLIDLGVAPICPIPDTFNNVGATGSVVFSNPLDNIPSCFTGGTVDRDVWFSFTVPTDGSIIDFTITLDGVAGPNGSILHPQVAVYRGECLLDELQELDCVTAAPGETSVEIDLLNLTPGLPYFLRISDWSASATPNWGDFVLCVKKYEPVFNMGTETYTEACAGTLFDSGGPDEDYSNNENLTFTICPQDFHQCIFLDISTFSLESNFDFLTIFSGPDINAPQLTDFTGFGNNVQVQLYSTCVTLLFNSDGSATDQGFEMTWLCSPDTCTVPPPSTCDNPNLVASLPYVANGMTTCNAGDDVTSSPCNSDFWLENEDVVFAYDSPGDECIGINITGSNEGTGVGIFDGCGDTALECLGQSGGGFGQSDPSINAVFLENAGTYYIVVDNANACTPFNIEITPVNCPVVFPSAADCEEALSLNGCGDLPAIISVAPGQGDPNFIEFGINEGCWGGFTPNFTFFYFQAQQDGDFGFIMQAADPDEASDIDFQVWGPISNFSTACNYAQNNQPIRSSYAGGADPTGLADINPINGAPVTDICEDAGGDDYVATIPVLAGEFYIVLVNDWGGAISSGAVSIDFNNTTPGVLDALGPNFTVTQDTAVCPGELAQLLATGGEIYQWFPEDGLSCTYCPNPVATIASTTTFQVAINSVCNVDTLSVEVGLLNADAGPDVTVCLNEELQFSAGSNFSGVTYLWNDPAGFLSCTDCPNPIVNATTPGTYNYEVTVSGPTCSFSDDLVLTVLSTEAPVFQISDDHDVCIGDAVNIGGTPTPGVSYNWYSDPAGFTSTDPNPAVAPGQTTVYYLEATNASCPLPSLDSVTVVVSNLPILNVVPDTVICQGDAVVLGSTAAEPGVTYTWSPALGLDDPTLPNPTATPAQDISYTLTASRQGCSIQTTVNVDVTQISISLSNPDTIPICKGVSVPLFANALPAGTPVQWSPATGLNTTTGANVIATPTVATNYVATVQVNGCIRMDTVHVGVDSLPWDMTILPADTTICQGEKVLLTSPIYEPGDFSQIEFQWLGGGQLTPDSFYNLYVQPVATTIYRRIATNGFCADTLSATVTVIEVTSVTITPSDPQICPGESVELTATAPVPIDFTWEPATNLSCTECPNPTASPASTMSYSVEGDYEGCPVGASVTVEVIPLPSIVPPTGVVCLGSSTALNLAPNAAWNYSWTSPDVPGFASNDPAPVVTPTTTTTYTVVVDNGICPPQNFEVVVQVSNNPTLVVSNDTTVCGSNPVSLVASADGLPGNFTWSPGNGTGPVFNPSLAPGDNVFTVTYTNSCGVNLTESVTVTVAPGVAIDSVTSVPTLDTVYQGTPVVLSVFTTPTDVTFDWSNGSTSDTASVTPLIPGNVTYTITVTDALGCTAVEEVSFQVLQTEYDIPNAFSPNGDSMNDVFQVVINGENVTVLSIQVWNRWGQLVYEESNGNTGWDGKFKDEDAASDVYVYRISMRVPDGSTFTESGDLTLLR